MFTILLIIKSILIGFVVAMPVGPIGVLCINHSIRGGMRHGISAGMGAALADGIFGFVAGLGSAALISGATDAWEFKLIGALLILLLGIKNIFTNRPLQKKSVVKSELIKTFVATFFLTLTNPLTVLSFAAIFAGVGIVLDEFPRVTALYLGLGIFVGSLLWWLSLAFFSSLISQRMNIQNIQVISRISGGILIAFAGIIFSQMLYSYFIS